MPKFTPGPWVQWVWHNTIHAGPVAENTEGCIRGGRGEICEVREDEFDEETVEANARLIAASPDLYEFVTWAAESDILRGTGMQAKAETLLAKVDGDA
jgi:hypothetical protein